jgi:hypothetical protein
MPMTFDCGYRRESNTLSSTRRSSSENGFTCIDSTARQRAIGSDLFFRRDSMPAKKKPGLYANIHAKQQRIAHGSGEKMRKPGEKGAPTAEAFKKAEKTEKGKKTGAKGAAKKARAKK